MSAILYCILLSTEEFLQGRCDYGDHQKTVPSPWGGSEEVALLVV